MKTKVFLVVFASVIIGFSLKAQNVAINATGNNPDPSAMLDIQSTTSGLLIPRMTELQRGQISSPVEGLLIYQTNGTTGFWFFDGSSWAQISGAGGDNLYDADGTLTGNRTVTHDNHDLTFATGTGKVNVDGTLQMGGALYANFRTKALPLIASDWTATDFTIRITGSGDLELPNPGINEGRIIALRNGEGTNRTFTANPPLNNSFIGGNRGVLLQSDGTNWHVIGGF